MSRLRTRLGDHLQLTVDGASRAITATVVGRVVMPPLLGTDTPGEGALMPNRSTLEAFGIDRRESDAPIVSDVYLRVDGGTDPHTVIADLNGKLSGESQQLYEVPRVEPRDLVDFGRVDGFPLLLGVVIALLAASTLVHVLVSSVRMRRHDLATLRAWHTSWAARRRRRRPGDVPRAGSDRCRRTARHPRRAHGVVGVRRSQRLHLGGEGADAHGVCLIALAIVAAELCAALPARTATRTRPAQLLRSE